MSVANVRLLQTGRRKLPGLVNEPDLPDSSAFWSRWHPSNLSLASGPFGDLSGLSHLPQMVAAALGLVRELNPKWKSGLGPGLRPGLAPRRPFVPQPADRRMLLGWHSMSSQVPAQVQLASQRDPGPLHPFEAQLSGVLIPSIDGSLG